jgi:hypothetical protein
MIASRSMNDRIYMNRCNDKKRNEADAHRFREITGVSFEQPYRPPGTIAPSSSMILLLCISRDYMVAGILPG